jgi:hypothetical protein
MVPVKRRILMGDSLGFGLRRSLIQCVAGMACAPMMVSAAGGGASSATPAGPVGSGQPKKPLPTGRAGEFDFLNGEWRIQNQRLKTPATNEWDHFESEATCWSILGGVASIEELRIPARNFSGMGLRLFDSDKQVWHELWMNAKSGSLLGPGMPGGFSEGVAVFEAEDKDGDTPIVVRSTWDGITATRCRWHQAVSRDGGVSWQANWLMDWERMPAR